MKLLHFMAMLLYTVVNHKIPIQIQYYIYEICAVIHILQYDPLMTMITREEKEDD